MYLNLDAVADFLLDYFLYQRGPTTGPRAACGLQMEFVRPAEQFGTSLVDHKQRQPFFFEERYDFVMKIGISEINSKKRLFFFFREHPEFGTNIGISEIDSH